MALVTAPAEEPLIDLQMPIHEASVAPSLHHPGSSRRTKRPEVVTSEKCRHGGSERRGVARFEKCPHLVIDDLREPANLRGRDGKLARHRLQSRYGRGLHQRRKDGQLR